MLPRFLTPFLLALLTVWLSLTISVGHSDTVLRRTTLLVHDLERSLEFYKALGFEPFYDASRNVAGGGSVIGGDDLPLAGEPTNSRIVVLIGPDQETGMVGLLAYTSPPLTDARVPLEGLGQGDVVLMLQVDDIELSRKAIAATGARFHREPYRYEVRNNEGQVRASGWRMFVYDPDERLIEIAQRDKVGDAAKTAIDPGETGVTVRRKFVDYRYGQLHLREAYPSDGTTSQPALLLFHQTPLSGRLYDAMLPLLARDRIVYAIDTPGYGESDAPPRPLSMEEYAEAIADFVTTLPGKVDVMGYHTGVLISMELARTMPDKVRSAVLVAVPLFSDEVRAKYQPNRDPVSADGAYLNDMWQSSMKSRAPGQSLERVAQLVAEKQRAGAASWWSGPGIFAYDTRARLTEVQQPVLVLRPADTLKEGTAEASELLTNAKLVDLPQFEYGFFDTHPQHIADIVLDFLDD